ncbi:MAG: DUF4412 domain-containing protein [Planctomycetes bacterium]|nr:DUF4412 domain-containing protein [Planctomycetota bacterium]
MKPAERTGPTTVVRLRIFVESSKIRIERPDAGQTIIADLAKGVVWSIDERKGVYYEAALADIAANWRRMRQAKGIELGEGGAVSLKQGDEKKSIMWHTCNHYVISADGKTLLELWTDKDFDFPEKDTIYRFRERMGEFSPEVLREIEKVPGFPLRLNGFTYVGTERMMSVREVKTIERRDIAPEKFKPPDGLKKVVAGQ